jgi:8-oxo-dGTP diphosphatase
MEHSKDFPDSFFRVTIKGLCVRDGKILLLKESPEISGKWEMPGGGLDFGEDIRAGLEREIREETGLKVTKMSEAPVYAWSYKYEGKRGLDWYYALVLAYRIELENLDFTPSEESEEIRFFTKEELANHELNGQTNELLKIFNPDDFKEPFL